MKKKKVDRRIILLILVPVILVIVFLNFRLPAREVAAEFTTYVEKVPFEGIYFTKEKVVYKGDLSGIKLNYSDGERIAKGFQISSNIIAPDAGILFTKLDGYENKYNLNNINNISLKEIENLIVNPVEEPGIKIIDNSEWYVCANIADNQWKHLQTGQFIEININDENYKDSLILNKFKNATGEFVVIRIKNDLDILNLQRGIKGYIIKNKVNDAVIIPKSAIVSYNGKDGVYIAYAGYADFRAVKILSYDGKSVVVEPDTTEKRQLQQYDLIITNPFRIKVGTKVN